MRTIGLLQVFRITVGVGFGARWNAGRDKSTGRTGSIASTMEQLRYLVALLGAASPVRSGKAHKVSRRLFHTTPPS